MHMRNYEQSDLDAALGFFYGLGFDVLGQLELIMDLRPAEQQVWRAGAELAGRPFVSRLS